MIYLAREDVKNQTDSILVSLHSQFHKLFTELEEQFEAQRNDAITNGTMQGVPPSLRVSHATKDLAEPIKWL